MEILNMPKYKPENKFVCVEDRNQQLQTTDHQKNQNKQEVFRFLFLGGGHKQKLLLRTPVASAMAPHPQEEVSEGQLN